MATAAGVVGPYSHMQEEHGVDDYSLPTFFRLHDMDGDRRLDRRELAVLYGGHDLDVDPDMIDARLVAPILAEYDADGDGMLSLEEYQRALDMDVGQPAPPASPVSGKCGLVRVPPLPSHTPLARGG
jgi:hypothetical protein